MTDKTKESLRSSSTRALIQLQRMIADLRESTNELNIPMDKDWARLDVHIAAELIDRR